MKKNIKSDKEVETYLFCDKVKKMQQDFDERYDYLMDKEELDDLQGGLKVLNLEDDEDISHHISVQKLDDNIRASDEF